MQRTAFDILSKRLILPAADLERWPVRRPQQWRAYGCDLAWSGYDDRGGTHMVSVLGDKMDAIRQSCKNYNVVRLDIFGSALREDFEPDRSDIDLLVDFGPMPPFDKPDAYFGLLNELRNILGTEVDLVMVGALKNRYIRDDINRTKQQLYAA